MKKWLTLLAALPLAVLLGDQLLARGAAEQDRFTADLSVRQGHGAETGERIDWAPERRYRIERERTSRAWKTTVMMEGGAADPATIVGIIDTGEGDELQLVDREGRRRPMPDVDALTKLLGRGPTADPGGGNTFRPSRARKAGHDWIANIIQPAADREKRGRAIRLSLGQPRGKVRGFDQYIQTDGDRRREVLVDAVQGVPVEMSVGVGGVLESRTRLSYQSDVQGNLFRTGLRTERVDRENAERGRSVVDVQLSNIRVPKGGVR